MNMNDPETIIDIVFITVMVIIVTALVLIFRGM